MAASLSILFHGYIRMKQGRSATPAAIDSLYASSDELRLVTQQPTTQRSNLISSTIALDVLDSVYGFALNLDDLLIHWCVDRATARSIVSKFDLARDPCVLYVGGSEDSDFELTAQWH